MHLPKLIGHRGLKGLAPENTLASFKKAKELGFSWVEFDVMLSACGEAIVFHDSRLKRTTNGKGWVSHKTYAELSKLDAGTWFNKAFANEPIPTLQQTLVCLAELELAANIEIKPSLGKDIATAQKTLEIIHAHWPQQLVKPLISSFSRLSLATVHSLDSTLPLAMLYNKLPRNWQKTADALNCVSINLNQKYVTLTQIRQIKQTGRLALVYTVNDFQQAQSLFAWGVNAIFTDSLLPAMVSQ